MGYNRSGRRFKDRIKRSKRLDARLAARAETKEAAEDKGKGIAAKVKGVAKGVVDAVGGAVKSVVHAVTGK